METWSVIFGLLMSFYLINYVQGQVISKRILQILERTTGFSKFAQLVHRAELTEFYNVSTNMTVFAFNDKAYYQLPYTERNEIDSYNVTELQDYLKYSSVYGYRITTSSLRDNQYELSMSSNGDRLYFNRIQRIYTTSGVTYETKYYVNGVEISEESRDISATNGIVQALNGIIRKTIQKTVYRWIQDPEDTTRQFTIFLDLMSYLYTMDSLNEIFSSDNITTLFIPSDSAMKKIPTSVLIRLKNDPSELQRVIQAHYLRHRAIFTNCIPHNESFTDANDQPLTFRKSGDNVYVYSGGSGAAIMEGNITLSNGVVHVVDQLLGLVYNTIRDQIQKESMKFDQLINLGTEKIRSAFVQPSGVTVFAPFDNAFQKIANIPWANLTYNQTLADMVIRLHILMLNNTVRIASFPAMSGYDSRQYRQTMYKNERVIIYNDRDETWVHGGNVKARIIRPDIETVNGLVHIIDSVLGIPYLDLPMLICHDIWLLRTYDFMIRVGLKNYLTDRRFTAETCSFEKSGYPFNYVSAVHTNQDTTCPMYCSLAPYQNQYPCNSALCQPSLCPTYCAQEIYQNQYPCKTAMCILPGSNCPTYCSQPDYANIHQCLMNCNMTSATQCQYVVYCRDPSNANKAPCNTYPCNMLNTGTQSGADYDMGCCGTSRVACEFTVFVPNSSAVDYFSLSLNGFRVMIDTPRFQYLFKRLIAPGRIYLEKLTNGNHQIKMLNGETINVSKANDRDVRIYFGDASANVLYMDEGATNGVMHIIDQLLFVQEDITRHISPPKEVIDEDEMRKGFCYKDTQKLGIHTDCDSNSTSVVIEEDSKDDKKCQNSRNSADERVTCVVGGYNEAYRKLTFTLTSNSTENSGNSILVNTTCDAGTGQSKNITLFPCFSCFKANVTHNETHAVIMCQHSFFNVSEQISIIDWTAGVPIEICRWNQSTSRTECDVQNHGGLTSGHDDQRMCCSVYIIIFVALLLSTLKLS
ncbi:uncharacterized protein LOC134259226 isoform X2 [Saccostrea cucullata]|uniref:uncharacterized protein LOC134259226 isoform X2 n=1 Tax=Saccostrea cuccullata TaxID=36930 RepID=UPI002ED173B4